MHVVAESRDHAVVAGYESRTGVSAVSEWVDVRRSTDADLSC